jgi:hypothetical protein
VKNENCRYLATATGEPLFWLGNTAWELFHRLTREEAAAYLETRRRQGFNVIQAVALAEFDGIRAPNAYGELALIEEDPTRPNEAYFRHVDFIIDTAATRRVRCVGHGDLRPAGGWAGLGAGLGCNCRGFSSTR